MSDSTTLDVKPPKTRFSDKLTIRCDPEMKKAVLAFAEQSGLSLCQIYDALTKAFLTGIQASQKLGVQSPTINLFIERQVQRVRRYAPSPSYPGQPMVTDEMEVVSPRCAECQDVALLRLRKEKVGWVFSCSSHREMFMKRGFVQELTV